MRAAAMISYVVMYGHGTQVQCGISPSRGIRLRPVSYLSIMVLLAGGTTVLCTHIPPPRSIRPITMKSLASLVALATIIAVPANAVAVWGQCGVRVGS